MYYNINVHTVDDDAVNDGGNAQVHAIQQRVLLERCHVNAAKRL